MDVNHDGKLRFNETELQKSMFDKIDANHDSALTVNEIKDLIAHLQEKLNALETSADMDSSHTVTLSSGVQSTVTIVEPTSQLIVSSPVAISSSSADISSSSIQSTLLKASPSSELDDLIIDLDNATAHLQ